MINFADDQYFSGKFNSYTLIFCRQGDIFGGLNDGLLSRAEALAVADMKHQTNVGSGLSPLKHDMMYHSMAPHHNPSNVRQHQVKSRILS